MIVLQFVLAKFAEDAATPMQELALLANHKSVGITIFLCACLRLAWRLRQGVPPPLPMPGWQAIASHISHWTLYGLIFLTPITGWLMSSAVGTTYVNLTIEENDGQLEAYVYNGPSPLRVNGNEFEVDLDWFRAFHRDYNSTFSGKLNDDDTLEGDTLHFGAQNFLGRSLKDGKFTDTRDVPSQNLEDLAPDPVDLTGMWNRASGQWFVRKLKHSFTEHGQDVFDNYMEMDNAVTRCAAPGLMSLATTLPYPMEILHTDDYIVMAIGADFVRRIYLDGREFPDYASNSSLGFSRGEWKGETLVVTTTRLNSAFITSKGQPVSGDAYTVEHYFFDEKGYLHADLWLHDPVNYKRPPYFRRVYDRNFSPSVITKVNCDPFTFFRALYLEGELSKALQSLDFPVKVTNNSPIPARIINN